MPLPRGFNPRTRVGCDQQYIKNMRNLRCFNPRTRVGCDLRSVTSITLWMMFQSTHPRGVRHVVYHDVDPSTVVSIHAPAWGATLDYSQRATFFAFQSTHPRGVRLGTMVFIGSFTSFNPRTRVGCDGADNTTLPSSPVSIHAPAWGATPCSCDSRELRRVSIHAPAWGATVMVIDKLAYTFVSIHAPAWGATKRLRAILPTLGVSIHAPAWGATELFGQTILYQVVSIHAPAWGATQFDFVLYLTLGVSIHAPAWGATKV